MIYELLALRASGDPDLRARDRDEQLSTMTWKASQLIEAGDLPAAERAYRAILESFPVDPVAKLMLRECAESLSLSLSNPTSEAGESAHA